MKRTPLKRKSDLAFLIKTTFASLFPARDISHSCLQVAGVACHVLKDAGYEAGIQAGSSFWPYKSILLDDKDTNTFGYEFDTKAAALALINGKPPEIHVWVGIADTQEILDFTTEYQVKQCKKMLGHDWSPELKLPEFIWHNVEDCLKRAWHYKPSRAATQLAVQLWNNELRALRKEEPTPLKLTCTANG